MGGKVLRFYVRLDRKKLPMKLFVIFTLAIIVSIEAAPASPVIDEQWDEPRGSLLTEGLKCLFLVGPVHCAKGKSDADISLAAARESYPAHTLHNGIGDAFRHCYWNALMTLSIGRNSAKKIADLHEDNNPTGPIGEREMDLKNNEIGRQVGSESTTPAEAREKCDAHVQSGYLQLSP